VDLATSSGQVTNAVYGFTSMLIKLLTEEKPDRIVVAFDKGRPTVRLAQYAEYKAGRAEAPDDFRQQLPLIKEVLDTLAIPTMAVEGHEADDAIATLALRAVAEGMEAVIVTADRDFFQIVRPGIRVMFNRKGISDIVDYDEKAVEERFGLPPEKYLDYVALKGDPSDNIPGVPGVGEKTASKLIQEHGTVEAVLANADALKPKLSESIKAAGEQLILNKDLARLQTDIELEIEPDDCVMGPRDDEAVRRLFNSLEFRTLLERLEEAGVSRPPTKAEELSLEQVGVRALTALLSGDEPRGIALETGHAGIVGFGISTGEGTAAYLPLAGTVPPSLKRWLADPSAPKWVHDAKEMETAARLAGLEIRGVVFDTLLAGYLLDPAEASYPLASLTQRYLGTDLVSAATAASEEDQGQLPLEETWRSTAAQAAATALLAPILAAQVEKEGAKALLDETELPLAGVLARVQAAGVRLDVDYLREMSETVGDRMRDLEEQIYTHAGEEFNLNSPPQLRVILYEKLGLSPGKKTSKGQLSTDASVLEKLRDAHPIVDALLQYREISKLKSTYLDALPPLVKPETGRVHTTYNQVGAATGRLSSINPNLQNIPVRGETGRQIRKAFVADPGNLLLVADYSQIELRVLAHLSGDQGLGEAFATDTDIHAATAAKAFRLPLDQVDAELRRRAKMVNYGLAYGMNAFGLASRLGIPPDEAQEFIDAYFEGFPKIREFLDKQVAHAAAEGFTATILGRRRYLPELQSPNPRIRDMGRRMALNAPVQGSAADIMKLAMIRVDAALETLPATMVLTVHDELVFEVPASALDEVAEAVVKEMESAYELSVPLRVDVGSAENWSDAAPAGH
jgi:DNA polymerase-1